MGTRLTLIVITKNEERCIERCIRSIDADETIVFDSGSTDRTVEIARALGARVVVTEDWPGYGNQKNRALARATGDWVLSLDADEYIDLEFSGQIRDAITLLNPPSAYRLRVAAIFCGKALRFGGWSSRYHTRLFRRSDARFSDDAVHERVVVDGKTAQLGITIMNDTIESWSDAEDKISRYSTGAARQLITSGIRPHIFSAYLHGAFAFFKTYILRMGVLDGAPGLGVAIYSAKYTFFKWFKAWKSTRDWHKQRNHDIASFWPVCKYEAETIYHARSAFLAHVRSSEAWKMALTDAEIVTLVNSLK